MQHIQKKQRDKYPTKKTRSKNSGFIQKKKNN